MNLWRFPFSIVVCAVLSAGCVFADDPPYACWTPGAIGEWVSTNWTSITGSALPAPGYPINDYCVDIPAGMVSISSQDIATMGLRLNHGSTLSVDNGRSLTLTDPINFQPEITTVGYVVISNGYVNLQNSPTGTMYGLSFAIGTSNSAGYLDFGSIWGTSNGFSGDYGTLYRTAIYLQNGGFRVDALNIAMQTGCSVSNAGQEMTFRGDWLNPDGTTLLTIGGKGTGTIDIAGNFFFGGCQLNPIIDTDGINLIQVGGDAILTNSVLTVAATEALTDPESTYDLIRVPADKTIFTNGLICCVASNGGFAYSTSVETNRNGYNYLVITPGQFMPSVVITCPTDESFFTAITNISLQASASGRSGSITKIEFYADGNKIAEANNAPYDCIWTNVYAGYYEMKAIATDNNGNRGESPVVGVNVQGTTADGRKVFITGGAVITYDPGCAQ